MGHWNHANTHAPQVTPVPPSPVPLRSHWVSVDEEHIELGREPLSLLLPSRLRTWSAGGMVVGNGPAMSLPERLSSARVVMPARSDGRDDVIPLDDKSRV